MNTEERTKMLANLARLQKETEEVNVRVTALPMDLAYIYLEDILETKKNRLKVLEQLAKIRKLGEKRESE